MNRALYKSMNDQIEPSQDLIQKTIVKARQAIAFRKGDHTQPQIRWFFSIGRPVLAGIQFIICLLVVFLIVFFVFNNSFRPVIETSEHSIETSESSHEGFAIYLIDDKAPFNKMKDLSLLELPRTPLITQDDVISYSSASHEMQLYNEAASRINNSIEGKPFVICVDRQPIYWGAFWWSGSSVRFNGVFVFVDQIEDETIKFEFPYSDGTLYGGQDPRNDALIIEALNKKVTANSHLLVEATFRASDSAVTTQLDLNSIKSAIEKMLSKMEVTDINVEVDDNNQQLSVRFWAFSDMTTARAMIAKLAAINQVTFQDEKGKILLDGCDVANAKAIKGPDNNYMVGMTLTAAGAEKFAAATKANIGRRLSVRLGDRVLFDAVVQAEITGGSLIIDSLDSTAQSAEKIASDINVGILPIVIQVGDAKVSVIGE
jgi:hypothetical protein